MTVIPNFSNANFVLRPLQKKKIYKSIIASIWKGMNTLLRKDRVLFFIDFIYFGWKTRSARPGMWTITRLYTPHIINLLLGSWSLLKKYSLPNKKTYISYCNSREISPKFWTDEELYEDFITYYDELYPYQKQLETSFTTVFQICEWLGVDDPSKIFEELDGGTVLELLRRRKISPWLFFNSTVFMDYLKTTASVEERDHIQKVTNPKRWREIFEKNPDKRKKVIDLVKEMGLWNTRWILFHVCFINK